MKTKKMKLSLNKNTVANLNNGTMRAIQGGRSEQGITIPPCTDEACQTPGCNPSIDSCIPCPSVPNYITCLPEQCITDEC